MREINRHLGLSRPVSAHGEIHPRRRPGRTVAAVLVVLIAAFVLYQLSQNKGLGWPQFRTYLFYPAIIRGIGVTLVLTLVGMVGGILGGFVLVMAMRSGNRLLSSVAGIYIWLVRGVPLLVQIIFCFNFAIIVPRLVLHVPGTSLWREWDMNDLMSGFTAAVIALVLNEAAYMAEIIRGSLASVPVGQTQAALSLGFTSGRALRRVVFPQTIRALIPPTGNQLIGMIKNTSLVSAVGGGDLFTHVQYVYGSNFAVVPLLLVGCFWYLVITSILSIVQMWIEHRLLGGGRRRTSAVEVRSDGEGAVEA